MNEIDAALVSRLEGDEENLMALIKGVWNTRAPDDATYPLLLFQLVSGDADAYTLGQRVSSSMTYQFRIVDEQTPTTISFTEIKTAIARVDVLLTDFAMTVSPKTLWKMRRERPARQWADQVANIVYVNVLAEFAIEVA